MIRKAGSRRSAEDFPAFGVVEESARGLRQCEARLAGSTHPTTRQYQLENTCERIVEGVPKAKRFLHESRDLLSA